MIRTVGKHKYFFFKHQNKIIFALKLVNLRSRMTLKSSEVIFWALKTSAASLTSAASATSLSSIAYKCQFPQKNSDPDGLIITGTKITNTDHFLWNGSHKIQFSLIYMALFLTEAIEAT